MLDAISEEKLKSLFTKPYGKKAPSRTEWFEFYEEDVLFIDPTQEKQGLNAYIVAQEKLLKRCDDIFIEPHLISITGRVGFVEWTMRLKIQNKEFVYPGVTKLIFGNRGKIIEHRDYFDFCGPTFGPVPILGGFVRWLYSRFIS